MAQSAAEPQNAARNQRFAPRSCAPALTTRCSICRERCARPSGASGRLPAAYRRGRAARVGRALAVYRARSHPRRACDRAGCGTGLGRRRRRARSRPALAARRPRRRSLGRRNSAVGAPARGAHQPRRGLGRKALAGRALRGRGAGAHRARPARAGQCRPRRRAASRGHLEQPAARPLPLAASLAQLIALTRRVALAIAGDTGPLHLACALGRPVVGIYGPTDPSRNGPFGTRFRVLRSPESRRDHTRRAEPGGRPAHHPAGRRAAGRRRTAGRGDRPDDPARQLAATGLDRPLAAGRPPHPRSAGLCHRGALPL